MRVNWRHFLVTQSCAALLEQRVALILGTNRYCDPWNEAWLQFRPAFTMNVERYREMSVLSSIRIFSRQLMGKQLKLMNFLMTNTLGRVQTAPVEGIST